MPLPQAARFDLLLGLIGRINSTIELDALLAAIMDAAKVIMEAQASSLMMLDPQTGELIVSLPTGPARAEISGMRIPPGKGFGGWVATHGEPLVVADAASDPRFYGDLAKGRVPDREFDLRADEKFPGRDVIGVLQALNPTDRPAFDATRRPPVLGPGRSGSDCDRENPPLPGVAREGTTGTTTDSGTGYSGRILAPGNSSLSPGDGGRMESPRSPGRRRLLRPGRAG